MERGIADLLKFVDKSDDVKRLLAIREKAEAKGEYTLARAVTERLSAIAVARGNDPIEPAFDKMLDDNKKLLGAPRTRTIQAIDRRVASGRSRRAAIVEILSSWALVKGSRKGFDDLKAAGRLDATGEAIILRFPSYFPDNIVAAARGRLEAAGWESSDNA